MHCTFSAPHRRTRRFQWPTFLAGACFLAAAMGLNSARAAGPDLSTPKKAALEFAKALMKGDIEAVKLTATGTEKEFALVKSIGDMMQAMKHYEEAAVKKFGPEAQVSKEDNKDLVAEVEASEEKIEGEKGDKATLINKANPNDKNPMTLAKQGAEWKVDLSTLTKDPESAKILDLSKAMVAALDGTTKDVNADKFKTAKEAKSAMESAMLSAMLKAQGDK